MTTVEPAAGATLDLDTVVAQTDDIGTLAPVAMEVIRLVEDDNSSMADLSRAIMADPALSARLLQLANSAQYAQAKEVTSLDRAASLIGLNTIKLLALGFTLVTKMTSERVDSTIIWRRSIATAVVAQRLVVNIEPRFADETFVAGLLGNVGKLTLADHDVYADAIEHHGHWLTSDRERQTLGFSTDVLSGKLLQKWNLPSRLTEVVVARSERADDEHIRLLGDVLAVADAAAMLMLTSCSDEAAIAYDRLRLDAASRLGMSIDQVEETLNLVKPAMDELTAMFNFEVVTASPAEIMMSAAAQLTKLSLNMASELAQEQQRTSELEAEKKELTTQASTDGLTGLANRRTFDAYLGNQIASRTRHPKDTALGLILFDLDHFKSVNDSFGHTVGDQVLIAISARIAEGTRRNELSARVGGEEFALIVPDTSPAELAQAAERFRALIDDEPVPTDIGLLHVTASVGVGYLVAVEGENAAKKLYESADSALYRSKQEGRNRVTITAVS